MKRGVYRCRLVAELVKKRFSHTGTEGSEYCNLTFSYYAVVAGIAFIFTISLPENAGAQVIIGLIDTAIFLK